MKNAVGVREEVLRREVAEGEHVTGGDELVGMSGDDVSDVWILPSGGQVVGLDSALDKRHPVVEVGQQPRDRLARRSGFDRGLRLPTSAVPGSSSPRISRAFHTSPGGGAIVIANA